MTVTVQRHALNENGMARFTLNDSRITSLS